MSILPTNKRDLGADHRVFNYMDKDSPAKRDHGKLQPVLIVPLSQENQFSSYIIKSSFTIV